MNTVFRKTRSLPLVMGITTFATAVAISLPTEAKADEPENFMVELSETDPDLLSGLSSALPAASMGAVVESANRTTKSCDAPANNLTESFCWQKGDDDVKYWYPQGVSSSADATGGSYDGKQVLLSAWYDNGTNGSNRGARISFMDMSDPSAPKYRHALLVEPSGSPEEPDFEPVEAHAGGLAWYGDKLYVCDTYNGWRMFDMSQILELDNFNEDDMGRQSDDSYAARGYRYVLPQTGSYIPSNDDTVDLLRYSQVSVDRTAAADSLVVSEWNADGPGTRIVRFDVGADGNVIPDTDGLGRGDWVSTVDFRSMQGATAVDGTYYVYRSNGENSESDLIKWTPGSDADVFEDALPVGAEDVSYWKDRDELWSQTEYPSERYVYATQQSSW